jgi:hypothetical protein
VEQDKYITIRIPKRDCGYSEIKIEDDGNPVYNIKKLQLFIDAQNDVFDFLVQKTNNEI